MKTTTMILMLAAGLAAPTLTAGPENSPSATTSQKKTVHVFYQSLEKRPSAKSDKIERYGGLSSLPWAQTAGWPAQTLFVDEAYTHPQFNLFWIGATPE